MNPSASNQNGGMAHDGTIVDWLDDKGYGWVKSGEKRYFAHIKDFKGGQRRPKAGEAVRFIPGADEKGRLCAKDLEFTKSHGRIGVGTWLTLAALLVLPLLALLWLPVPWWLGVVALFVSSALTYGMYEHDKGRAKSAGWRTPESTLHLAELFGGWPGALLAQRRLRHKCSKVNYQIVFWLIIIVFQIVAVDVILRHRLSRAALDFVTER